MYVVIPVLYGNYSTFVKFASGIYFTGSQTVQNVA